MIEYQTYLDGLCGEHDYYKQFVNQYIYQKVENWIGKANLTHAKRVENIPLEKWAGVFRLGFPSDVGLLVSKCGETPSVESGIKIAQSAGRMIKAGEQPPALWQPKPKILIDLTDEELELLREGEVFNWVHRTDLGGEVEVCIKNSEYDENYQADGPDDMDVAHKHQENE